MLQALDWTTHLADLHEGFVNITDESLAMTENVKMLIIENDEKITPKKLYCALNSEKTFYRVKWNGGGSLTVRCFK